MLDVLLSKLVSGPFETSIILHGPHAPLALKVQIISADHVGIVASVKGMLGGWGEQTGFPWPAISKVTL